MDRAYRLGKPVVHLGMAAALLGAASLLAQAQPMDEKKHRRVRLIAPSIVAGPRVDPENLQRIAPRAPLGASRVVVSPPPGNALPSAVSGPAGAAVAKRAGRSEEGGMVMLFRPVADAAGRFEADGRSITVAGIDVVEADRSCGTPEGGSWPCGMRARTAFRYWLRGRAVACDLEDARKAGGTEIATCEVGGDDLGIWLIDRGWALADPAGPYAQAGRAAREAGRGVFGGGRARR